MSLHPIMMDPLDDGRRGQGCNWVTFVGFRTLSAVNSEFCSAGEFYRT